MAGFNFADEYRSASLNPGPEIIARRQAPFDRLRKEMKPQRVVDITRLYFGLPVPGGVDWFRDSFANEDPSFSLIRNEREVAVLASCLLSAALDDGNVTAGLALMTCSVGDHRKPLVKPSLIGTARSVTLEISAASRRRSVPPAVKIGVFAKSKVADLTAALLAGGDWNKATALTSQISDEALAASKALAAQVQGILGPLVRQVGILEEETSILWWFLGAWSRVLNRPFRELGIPLSAAMAGLDVAALVSEAPGPPAVPTLLQRLLAQSAEPVPTEVTIQNAVDAFPSSEYSKLGLRETVQLLPDMAPVLTALRLASEIGSPGWHAQFKKITLLKSTTKMPPLVLAMQVYREAMLLSLVK